MALEAGRPHNTLGELVAADVKNEISPEDAARLRSPDMLRAFYDELVNAIARVDGQISRSRVERLEKYKEYITFCEEKERWRLSALGFRRVAAERLHEVKALLRGGGDDEEIELIRLRSAIAAHKAKVTAGTEDDEDSMNADEELWSLLGG